MTPRDNSDRPKDDLLAGVAAEAGPLPMSEGAKGPRAGQTMKCRFCDAPLTDLVIDLGDQPSANRLLSDADMGSGARNGKTRLAAYLCSACALVQLGEAEHPESLFTADYVYYSSYSREWVKRAKEFVELAIAKFGLDAGSRVLEIGSNDGYLLQHLVSKGIPCRGVDPAGMAASEAGKRGVETFIGFFDSAMAEKIVADFGLCDLLIGNNVFAHIPDIRETIDAINICLAPDGILSLEFPHLADLVEGSLFDTIYDEHYFYFSVIALEKIFRASGLKIFEIQSLKTHGGSLRVFATREASKSLTVDSSVARVLDRERRMNLDRIEGFRNFQQNVERIRCDARQFIQTERAQGRTIGAFGAAAKGNIFLNYCGIGVSEIEFVADDTPAKQGKFLPGSRIPVVSEATIRDAKPDVIVILPWNVRDEVCAKLEYVREWGCRLVTFVPHTVVN